MLFDSSHVATTIDRSAQDVYSFVSDPRNLPAWAAGLAEREGERVDDEWVVDSPMGRVKVAFAPENALGVADHDVTLPNGEVVTNPLRVIANGSGCDVIFTVHRRTGVSAAAFAADLEAVTADLAALRALMERRGA